MCVKRGQPQEARSPERRRRIGGLRLSRTRTGHRRSGEAALGCGHSHSYECVSCGVLLIVPRGAPRHEPIKSYERTNSSRGAVRRETNRGARRDTSKEDPVCVSAHLNSQLQERARGCGCRRCPHGQDDGRGPCRSDDYVSTAHPRPRNGLRFVKIGHACSPSCCLIRCVPSGANEDCIEFVIRECSGIAVWSLRLTRRRILQPTLSACSCSVKP